MVLASGKATVELRLSLGILVLAGRPPVRKWPYDCELSTSNTMAPPIQCPSTTTTTRNGEGQACRGASATDTEESYYAVVPGVENLEVCQVHSEEMNGFCKGMEFSMGRCELWTRYEGIQAIGKSQTVIVSVFFVTKQVNFHTQQSYLSSLKLLFLEIQLRLWLAWDRLTHPSQRRNSVALRCSRRESGSDGRRSCRFGHGVTSRLSEEATTSRFGSRAGHLHSWVRAESTMIKPGIVPTLCWPVQGGPGPHWNSSPELKWDLEVSSEKWEWGHHEVYRPRCGEGMRSRDLECEGMLCAHTAGSWRHSLRPCRSSGCVRAQQLQLSSAAQQESQRLTEAQDRLLHGRWRDRGKVAMARPIHWPSIWRRKWPAHGP